MGEIVNNWPTAKNTGIWFSNASVFGNKGGRKVGELTCGSLESILLVADEGVLLGIRFPYGTKQFISFFFVRG